MYIHLTILGSRESFDSTFDFFCKLAEDEHRYVNFNFRGIRAVAVESLSIICELQFARSDAYNTTFRATIKNLVIELLPRLERKDLLYRKKSDLLFIVSQLVVYINDVELRLRVIAMLVLAWRDSDSRIRKMAIARIIDMERQGVQEVIQCFKNTGKSESKMPDIMQEAVKLVNNPDYMDKDALQNLLKWRFTVVEKKRSGGKEKTEQSPFGAEQPITTE
jgi:hypothetical protein